MELHNKSLFFASFILVVAVALSGYLIFFAKPKITGLEVAIKTASFLDKTIQPDGTILEGFACSMTTGQCGPMVLNANQPDLSEVIYGYYKLAQVSGEESYKIKSDQIMDLIINKCRTNFQMCDWNTSVIASYYLDTKDDKYLKAILGSTKNKNLFLLNNQDLTNQDLINQNAGRSLALLYQVTKDERYKQHLLEVADEELSNWPRSQDQFEYSVRVVWSILLPAYTITNDRKYLTASEQFFDDSNLAENFDLNLIPFESILKGADALLSLSKVSDHGAVYKSQTHAVLQEILNQTWDNPENPKSSGDYGFGHPMVKNQNYVKKSLYNGWLIKLFAMMADEKFNLPTTK